MLLRVDFKSRQPVYRQLAGQIQDAAASGVLRPGETLPAIGALAEELRVGRNHVAKAYSELENLGVIALVPDKGYCLKEHHRPLRAGVSRVTEKTVEVRHAAPLRLRAAVTYSLVLFLLATLYFALVAIAGVLLVRTELIRGETVAVLATVVIAILFWPLRARVQEALDQRIFRKRNQLPIALNGLKHDFVSQKDLDSFLSRVLDRSEALIGARPLLVRDRGEVLELVNTFPALRSARQPLAAGEDLLMPLFSHDEVLGVLRVEARTDGRRHDPEDVEFLTAVGEHVAMAANQFRLRSERAESETAFDIQRALLPREIPQVPGFSIAGAWQPAKLVGGDYYDVFPLPGDRLALAVADVSGKGMAAALLMSNLQATTKAYASTTASPRELCTLVNRAITSTIASGKFITFFFGILDAQTMRFTYTNAGHNHPVLRSQDGTCRKLDAGGAVLGIFPDAPYEEGEVPLSPGDQLVIFTDGIVEAANSGEQEFGEERLISVMGANSSASAGTLRDLVMQDVTRFCRGDFADDATLLTVVVDS